MEHLTHMVLCPKPWNKTCLKTEFFSLQIIVIKINLTFQELIKEPCIVFCPIHIIQDD